MLSKPSNGFYGKIFFDFCELQVRNLSTKLQTLMQFVNKCITQNVKIFNMADLLSPE